MFSQSIIILAVTNHLSLGVVVENVKHTFACILYCSFPYVAVAANDLCACNYRLIGEHLIDCYIVY
jgi:hypothetical protein